MFYFSDGSTEYYAVALIKKNTLSDVYNLGHLKGKKACFAGVGTQAGWNIPVNTVRSTTTWDYIMYSINYFYIFSLFPKVL